MLAPSIAQHINSECFDLLDSSDADIARLFTDWYCACCVVAYRERESHCFCFHYVNIFLPRRAGFLGSNFSWYFCCLSPVSCGSSGVSMNGCTLS